MSSQKDTVPGDARQPVPGRPLVSRPVDGLLDVDTVTASARAAIDQARVLAERSRSFTEQRPELQRLQEMCDALPKPARERLDAVSRSVVRAVQPRGDETATGSVRRRSRSLI